TVSIGLHASNTTGTDDKSLVVTVAPADVAPVLTSSLSADTTVGAPFSYTLSATGSPLPTLSFTNLPTGITANGDKLTGTFSSTGQFSIGLHATSSAGT